MKKLLATAAVTAAIAVTSVAATTAPANAGIYLGFGGYGPYHHGHYGYGAVIAPPIYEPVYDDLDARHVQWCVDHYRTYDEDTNLYFYKPGRQRACVSPFS